MNRYIPTIAAWSMLMSTAIGQTIVDYRGLEIQSPDPTGAAGLRLQNNFKLLADRIGPSNLTATAAPTVDDDVDEGYYAGSLWYDTVGGVLYWCADNTDGAALWKDLSTSAAAAISDAAYAASWDDVTTIAPSKNTLYDYLSGLSSVYQAADADLTTWAGVTSSANGRSLVSADDYAAMRTLLSLATTNTPQFAELGLGNVPVTGWPLTCYQSADSQGLKIFGYDDQAANSVAIMVDSGGYGKITSSSQLMFGPVKDGINYIWVTNTGIYVIGSHLDFQSNTRGVRFGGSLASSIFSDASNLQLTDPTTGSKTLAQLAADTDTLGSIGSVANGDIVIYNSGWTRLAKGDDGQVLKLASGLPAWAADTDTNTTYTGGDGLTLTETDFDLDLKTGGGLEIDTGQLTVTAPLLIGEIGLSWHGTAAEVIDDAVVCPYSGTITSVIITANDSGSIELDVWKSASGVPTVADTICNASYPALSAAQQDKAISVAGWSSTAITAGDTIKFEVRSVSTITQATVQLVIAK